MLRTYDENGFRNLGALGVLYALSLALGLAQTLANKERVFLRLADDRGWTYVRNPVDNAVLFEEASGKIAVDT